MNSFVLSLPFVVLILPCSAFVLNPCLRSSVFGGKQYRTASIPGVSIRRLDRPLQFASSDWGDFTALPDDDDDDMRVDRTVYAKEEDPQEVKAQVGVGRPAPTIEYDAEPIFVPQGKYVMFHGGTDEDAGVMFVSFM